MYADVARVLGGGAGSVAENLVKGAGATMLFKAAAASFFFAVWKVLPQTLNLAPVFLIG